MYKCIYTLLNNQQKNVSLFNFNEVYQFCMQNENKINWFDLYTNDGERLSII